MIITHYLHSNKEDWYEEIDEHHIHDDVRYALYEVEFTLDIDPTTGSYKILQVKDGDQILVPKS